MSLIDDKISRIKYIRALNRFLNSTVSVLKTKEFDINKFKQKVNTHYDLICSCLAVRLNNPSHIKLLEYVNMCLKYCDKKNCDFEYEKSILLKLANQIQKTNKLSSYKKNKHTIEYD